MTDQTVGTGEVAVKVQPKLLSDQPETKDFFGAHTAIADALADIILHDNEGRCVAIEGAWGSGKSTVIGMLKNKLHTTADIFIFDTWSNQGDPLRYAFMGELASWVKTNFPELQIPSRNWLERINDSARRTTREDRGPISSKPKEAQRLVAALLVGMPLGLALSSDQWGKLFREEVATAFYLTGIALVLTPIFYLAWLRWTKKLDFFKEIVDAVERTADDTKKILIRRGPLATSLEFTKQVDVICQELHKTNPNRKMLVIFDNIDRVAERNSPKVWSLLTALLEIAHDKKKPYAKNIWVLVPVDLDSVPVPVSASREDADGDVLNADSINPQAHAEATHSLKRQFIEKTFQVTMVVPPPLSVASERYFHTQYQDAFAGTEVEKHWYECYAVFRDLKGNQESFTPRAIKRFINDLVGLYRARSRIDATEMPTIPLMTFYLCYRHKISHPNDLVPEFIPRNIIPHITDRNPIAALAAVAFGDLTSSGLILLVKAQADAVVETGDVAKFGDLITADGFPEAYAAYVLDRSPTWLTNDTVAMAKAYQAMGKLPAPIAKDVASRLTGPTRQLVLLRHAMGKMDVAAAMGMGYAAFLYDASKEEMQASLQAMLNHVAEGPAPGADMGGVWFYTADGYLKELVDRSVAFDGIRLSLPKKQELATQILRSHVAQLYDRGDIALVLDPSALAAITQTIQTEATNFSLTDDSLTIVKALRRISPTYDSTAACMAMQQRFGNATAMNAGPLGSAIELIDNTLLCQQSTTNETTFLNWMRTGFFHHHYQSAQGDKNQLTARLAGLMAGLGQTSAQIQNWNQANPGLANFQQACNTMSGEPLNGTFSYLVKAGRFHGLVQNASHYNLNPFRENLLRVMLATMPSLYAAESYCTEMSPILNALSAGVQAELTKYAIEQLGVDGYLVKLDALEQHLGFVGYERIGNAINEPARKRAFLTHVATLLRGQGAEWWQSTVKQSDATLLRLITTINHDVGGAWLHGDARVTVSELAVGQEFMTDENRRKYALTLMDALTKEERNVVVVRVARKAYASVGDTTEFGRIQALARFVFEDKEVLDNMDTMATNLLIPTIEHDPGKREAVLQLVGQYGLLNHLSAKPKEDLLKIMEPPPAPGEPKQS